MLDLNKMRVLIVDDMENMCKSVRGMLMVLHYGREFHYAYNGQEAWNLLQKNEIDFMICDWNMPIMTGVELLGNMKEDRRLREIPVIMVTAEANEEIVAEAAESEIDAYLLKPITVGSLDKKIQEVVNRVNNPTPATLYLKQAKQFEEAGDLKGAIEQAKLAMQAEPQSSKPIREMGYYLFQNNQLEPAKEAFLKAAAMNKLDVFANHYLGEIFLKEGNIDLSIKHFNQAMTISPRHAGRALEFGKLLLEKDLKDKAASVFDKAISVSDDPTALRESLLKLCLSQGMQEYAVKLMKKIVADDPKRNDIRLQLGLTYRNLGDLKNALTVLSLAASAAKENCSIKLHIARIYLRQNQQLRAERVIREALQVDPDNREAKELLRECL